MIRIVSFNVTLSGALVGRKLKMASNGRCVGSVGGRGGRVRSDLRFEPLVLCNVFRGSGGEGGRPAVWESIKDRRKRLALSRGPASFSTMYDFVVD